MVYIKQRSARGSFDEGSTDSKYLKPRPDTTLSSMNEGGDAETARNRRSLNPLDGYQTVEYPDQVNPGGSR